jgi:hypothetical protein
MWLLIAREMGIPWKLADAMHWRMGELEMAHRAGVAPFSKSGAATDAPKRRGPVGSSSSGTVRREGTNPVGDAGGAVAK